MTLLQYSVIEVTRRACSCKLQNKCWQNKCWFRFCLVSFKLREQNSPRINYFYMQNINFTDFSCTALSSLSSRNMENVSYPSYRDVYVSHFERNCKWLKKLPPLSSQRCHGDGHWRVIMWRMKEACFWSRCSLWRHSD